MQYVPLQGSVGLVARVAVEHTSDVLPAGIDLKDDAAVCAAIVLQQRPSSGAGDLACSGQALASSSTALSTEPRTNRPFSNRTLFPVTVCEAPVQFNQV